MATKTPSTTEIEVRFLSIDSVKLKKKLAERGAVDKGEALYRQEIRTNPRWSKGQLVRIRTRPDGVFLAYKHHAVDAIDGTEEIEFRVESSELAGLFCDRLGAVLDRVEEKRVHTFQLGDVELGFDTWPQAPTYLELEGPSESALREAANQLGLDWKTSIFENALKILENHFALPVSSYTYYTFDRVE
jgi:adenylate cyclase, class 2